MDKDSKTLIEEIEELEGFSLEELEELESELADEEEFSTEDYETSGTTTFLTKEERDELAEKNIKLVYSIASSFKNVPVDKEEIISVGLMGYNKALMKYNPNKSVKFSTFAYKCIKNEILYFIRNEKNINSSQVSIHQPVTTDKHGNELGLESIIPDESIQVHEEVALHEITDILVEVVSKHLSSEERTIIEHRFGLNGLRPKTQNELAELIGMSQANISKREKTIMEKIKKIMASKYKIKDINI